MFAIAGALVGAGPQRGGTGGRTQRLGGGPLRGGRGGGRPPRRRGGGTRGDPARKAHHRRPRRRADRTATLCRARRHLGPARPGVGGRAGDRDAVGTPRGHWRRRRAALRRGRRAAVRAARRGERTPRPVARLAALLLIGGGAGLASAWVEDVVKDGWVEGPRRPHRRQAVRALPRPDVHRRGPEQPHLPVQRPRRRPTPRRPAQGRARLRIGKPPPRRPHHHQRRPVTRAKLHRGDTIGIGATTFEFGEKGKG